MGNNINVTLAAELLKVAKADIKASKVLYENRLYAQSYFYFQQATEKATKAVALSLEMSTAKDSFNMRHNIFKLHRKNILDAKRNNQLTVDLAKALPFMETSGLIETEKLQKQIKSTDESLAFFDSMKQYDLINIPAGDITHFLKNIETLELKRTKIPEDLESKINGLFMPFIEKLEQHESKAAQYMGREMRDALKREEFGQFIREHFADIIKSFVHILYAHTVLYFAGFLTIQHSSKSRYPDTDNPGISPLTIYTQKLPVVKYQPRFLEHLEKAVNAIERNLHDIPN